MHNSAHSASQLQLHTHRWSLRLFLLLLAVIFSVTCARAWADNAETTASQQKLQTLLSNLKQIKSRLNKNTAQQSKLEKSIKRTETIIGQLVREQRDLNRQQKQLAAELAELSSQHEQLQAQINSQKTLVSEHLLKIYKSGNRNPVQLLLENGNPADIDRQLEYLERINRARHALLENYSQLLSQQQVNIQQTEIKQIALSNNQRQLAERAKELLALQTQRKQALAHITDEIGSDKKTANELEQNRVALQALLEEVSHAVEQSEIVESDFSGNISLQHFAKAKGQLPWPVQGKLRKHSDGRWRGVTISADEGSAVRAIFPGRVIFSDWFTGQGLLLIIDHGKGYWSLYGHNQSLLKAEGDSVAAGEAIATVGNSGGQSVAALYFEIRHNGTPNSPTHWCKS